MLLNFIVIAIVSAALTGAYRRLALQREWMDRPNARSSHLQITPRGAGIVFVLLIVAAAWSAVYFSALNPGVACSISAGLGIAALGWYDDIRRLSARVRFIGYWLVSLVALAFLYAEWSVSSVRGGGGTLIIGLLLCSAALQWLINLYNFMDGINGIAALEAVFVLAATLLLGAADSGDSYAAAMMWVGGGAVAALCGFLLWNFPRAAVFMGDAGSAFLGFLLGILLLWSPLLRGPEPLIWLILLGVFVVDASYTLLMRMATGQPWHQPHRLHAYQIVARRSGSHGIAVLVIMCVNIFWLLPWAWLAHREWIAAPWALLGAYSPLLIACYALGAGQPNRSRV